MRNPNETTTTYIETSTTVTIIFHYTSASVCNYDFDSIGSGYPGCKVEQPDSKTITVTYQK